MSRKPRENVATILARLFEGPRRAMSKEVARHLLKLDFSEDDAAVMRDLGHRYEKGTITAEEKQDLDDYLVAADLLRLLQTRARKALGE